jgi:hypothetical protein
VSMNDEMEVTSEEEAHTRVQKNDDLEYRNFASACTEEVVVAACIGDDDDIDEDGDTYRASLEDAVVDDEMLVHSSCLSEAAAMVDVDTENLEMLLREVQKALLDSANHIHA